MRALRQHGIDAEAALALYIQAMLRDKVLHKRWVRRSFLLWVERGVLEGTLPRGRPQPPRPDEEGLDELDAEQLVLPESPEPLEGPREVSRYRTVGAAPPSRAVRARRLAGS
jgi:hypothetical protein